MEGKVPLQTLSQEWTTAPDDITQTQLEDKRRPRGAVFSAVSEQQADMPSI